MKLIINKYLVIISFIMIQCIGCVQNNNSLSVTNRPNIIIIMAEDIGYGDLGCYGSIKNRSPNIDRLSDEGLKFTSFYSNGAVCSPTKAALMTGRYPQRMDITHSLGEGEEGLGNPKAKKEITIAQYLKEVGYHTGIVGKWHLGYNEEQNPTNFGFDEFRGMLHGAGDYHSHVNTFGRRDWWHNKKPLKEKGYITHLITSHSEELIETWKDKPFFLYISHNAIHFPWQTPDDDAHREEGKKYRDVSGPFNRLGPHPPEKIGEVIQVMTIEMDNSVGRIISKLRELDIDKKTLVFFFSDNGGILEYRGGYKDISSNGILRGAKSTLYEGGIRVPAIVWWPKMIKAGKVTDQIAMTMDVLPTIMSITGIKLPDENSENKIDGQDLSPLLFEEKSLNPRILFWQHGNSLAARNDNWKLLNPESLGLFELYNLNNDISEKYNLAETHPEIVADLVEKIEVWHQEVLK